MLFSSALLPEIPAHILGNRAPCLCNPDATIPDE
jgi:hypothetical protein